MRATILMVLAVVVGSLLPQGSHPPTPDASPPQACAHRLLSTGCATAKARVPVKSGSGTIALDPLSTPLNGFTDEVVWTGLTNPTLTRFAPDGRVFIAEKSGIIKVFASVTATTPTVFADLHADVHNFWDRGLLGLALDPAFPAQPYVYVAYTYDHVLGSAAAAPRWGTPSSIADNCPTPPGPTTDGCPVSNRVVRLKASAGNPNVWDGTQSVLVEDWCQQYPSHSIGTVAFGPDGNLWVSGGEGASFNFGDYGQGAAGGTSAGYNVCGDPGSAQFVPPAPPTAEGGSLRSQDVRTTSTGTSSGYRQTVVASTPLRYWRLGEAGASTQAFDQMGGPNGTYANTPTLGAAGAIANDTDTAASFASSQIEFIELNSDAGYPMGAAARSTEAWVKTSTAAEQAIIQYGAAATNQWWSMRVAADGRLAVDTHGATRTFGSAGALSNGAWHHVVATYDGTVMRAYIDGAAATGSGVTTTINTVAGNHWIGTTGSSFFNGSIDEVALYTRALSAADVASHYQAASSVVGGQADPVGLDGTIIRIDPSTGAGVADNPLAASTDANARRIVAYGYRNPFRFTFRPGTSELWIGDVGAGTWEEINRVANPLAGATNNGWPCYEGPGIQGGFQALNLNICANLYTEGTAAAPYYTYNHADHVVSTETCTVGSSSISGLAFYPTSGGPYPATYQGALFFADHSRNCIWAMVRGANGLPDPSQIQAFVQAAANPVDLVVGPDGMVWYTDYDTGTIHRIRANGSNTPPTAIATATPTSGVPPLLVQLDASQSSDPDAGQTLTYSWDVDGNGTFGDATGVSPQSQYPTAGTFQARVLVTDSLGASTTSAPVTITVGAPNTPPVAVIDTPSSTFTWRVGTVVDFSGHGTDTEDGAIPASKLRWDIILRHCPSDCHSHTITSVAGTATGSFTAPDHEYPSHIQLTLTVTDAAGVSSSTSIDLNPQTVDLTFATSPAGLQLGLNTAAQAAPFTKTVIIGSSNSLSAGSPQTLGTVRYQFGSWSDGGAAAHSILAPPTAATYTATYTPISADVRITKTGVSNVGAKRATFTLAVTNLGPAGAAAVVVRDTLPSKLTWVSSSSTVGSCTRSGQVVTCNLGTLASGASATVTIVSTAKQYSGSVSNTATVSSTTVDLVTGNNTSTISLRLR